MSVDSIERFGPFVLLEQLSSSEICDLYLAARTEGSGKDNQGGVVKRLKPHSSSEQAYLDAFLEASRAAGQLEQPQICRVFDFGMINERPFLARDYAPGKDLRNLLRRYAIQRRLIPQPIALLLAIRISSALAYAHPRIIHGCLTPQDIIIGFEGEVRLINFGMGSFWARRASIQAAVPKEKSAYFSPEHITRGELDHRSDVFSLGVLLYELLTGKQVFNQGLNEASLGELKERTLPPPSDVRPSLDIALDSIVMRALDLDPQGRYQDIAEFAEALHRVGLGGQELSELEVELGTLMMRTFTNEYRLEKDRTALLATAPAKVAVSGGAERVSAADSASSETPTRPAQAGRGSMAIWIGMGVAVALVTLGALFYLQSVPLPAGGQNRSAVVTAGQGTIPAVAAVSPTSDRGNLASSAKPAKRVMETGEEIALPPKETLLAQKGNDSTVAPIPDRGATAKGATRSGSRGDSRRHGWRPTRYQGNPKRGGRSDRQETKVAVRAEKTDDGETRPGISRPPDLAAISNVKQMEKRDTSPLPPTSGNSKAGAPVMSSDPVKEENWGYFKIISAVLVDVEVDGWRSAVNSGNLNLKLRVGQHKIRVIFRESGKEFITNVTIKPNKTTKLKLVHG